MNCVFRIVFISLLQLKILNHLLRMPGVIICVMMTFTFLLPALYNKVSLQITRNFCMFFFHGLLTKLLFNSELASTQLRHTSSKVHRATCLCVSNQIFYDISTLNLLVACTYISYHLVMGRQRVHS